MLQLFRAMEDDPLASEAPAVHGSGGPIPIYRPKVDTEWGELSKALKAAAQDDYGWCADMNAPDSAGVCAFPVNTASSPSGEHRRISISDG